MTGARLAAEIRIAAAVKWYELGRVSQEVAAKIAGVSRTEFLSLLSRMSVSPMQETANEASASAKYLLEGARPAVLDASPFIILAQAGFVQILPRLMSPIVLPRAVVEEIHAGPADDPARRFLTEIPD